MTTPEFRNILAESEHYEDFCDELDAFVAKHNLDGTWEANGIKYFEDEHDSNFTQEELDEYIEHHGLDGDTTTTQDSFIYHWYLIYLEHVRGLQVS